MDHWLQNPDHAMAVWTIAIAAMCAVSCSLVGTFLLLERASLFGDAVSHAVLPGIVVAFLLTGSLGAGPMAIAAAVMGGATALAVHWLSRSGVSEDSSLGVTFVTLFALGVVLMANFARKVDLDVSCVLFGSLEQAYLIRAPAFGTSLQAPRAFITLALCAIAVVALAVVFWKELKIASFDPALAAAMGFSASRIRAGVMVAAAIVAVASFEAVGSILVVGLMIVPAATARLLTDRLSTTVLLACGIGALSSPVGYWIDLQYGSGTAPAIILACGALFIAALLFAPRQGMIAKMWSLASLRIRIAGEDLLAMRFREEEAVPFTPDRSPRPPGWLMWLAERRLKRTGMLRSGAGASELTARGREAGRSLIRSHRLWERYLGEHFALPLDHLHGPAEMVEHFIGPDLQRDIAAKLTQTSTDPHGKPIPETTEPSNQERGNRDSASSNPAGEP